MNQAERKSSGQRLREPAARIDQDTPDLPPSALEAIRRHEEEMQEFRSRIPEHLLPAFDVLTTI